MGLLYRAYATLSSGLFFSCFAPLWAYTQISGRRRSDLRERAGLVPRLEGMNSGSPRIWLHAASLGEVKVAAGLKQHLQDLLPGCSLIVSTSTGHGRDLAANLFQGHPVIYAPLDTPFSVRHALSRIQPDIMVFLETEIWPVWITEAKKMGAKVAIVNGRISVRSIKRYLALHRFFRDVLRNVDVFSMILEEDGERIVRMGADRLRVRINGNAKYELLALKTDPSLEAETRKILNLGPTQVVLVAGSTREGEEEMVLDAYERISKRFPETVLVIAPRHIVRTAAIESILKTRSIRYLLWTDLCAGAHRVEPVVVLNAFGELLKLYSVGSIVFCGASLVPLGGQNPLEPAAWGKVVFYGPFMEDFLDAKDLLESVDAGIEVANGDHFAKKAIELLSDPEALRSKGDRARQALLTKIGAAERHARVIAELAVKK
jgi:3-deoxy-D-manno-octulosonic-acid transferase